MASGSQLDWGALLRRAVLAWLTGVLLVYNILPPDAKRLTVRADLDFLHLSLMTAVFAAVFCGLNLLSMRRNPVRAERWGIFALCLILTGESLLYHPQLWYGLIMGGLTALSLIYAVWGRSSSPAPAAEPEKRRVLWILLTAAGALLLFVFLAVWGLSRVKGYAASTFDFGLFAQMFHKMKTTGLPLTTLERDGLLSHFAVHLSPIWYLLLPFWLIWPKPELLPLLQAAILSSSVIPLWLLAKELGFSPLVRCMACAALLAHPALSGGTSYDIHENCFLTPLLLWLFWAAEGKRPGLTFLFAGLTCAVKEDAPVYVAVLGLYLLVRGLLDRQEQDRKSGLLLFGGAVAWFLGAVLVLRIWGEGIMDYRYLELMDPHHLSLFSVILTVVLTPLRAVEAAAQPEKLLFALRFLGPLLALPILTRKQERYLLLIPFVLYHLLSSYHYQYDLLFQYGFGTLAFAMYLALLNLRDLLPRLRRVTWIRAGAMASAAAIGLLVLRSQVLPHAKTFIKRYTDYREGWAQVSAVLETVPREASVTSCTYFTQGLCDRAVVYDLYYTSVEHLLESDYVVLEPMYELDFKHWASAPEAGDGKERLYALLEESGYRQIGKAGDWIEVWKAERDGLQP